MRLFIAIPIPQNIKDYLCDIQMQFKKCDLFAKWVNPQNVHMTLKFLGEVKEEKIQSIENVIKETIVDFSALEVNLKEFGFFPNERNPRVFFISTDKEEILQKLSYILEEKIEPLGFEREYRFKSHITIARLKNRKNIDCLVRKTKQITPDKSFPVDSIILYKSTLARTGPIYEEIFKSSLKV